MSCKGAEHFYIQTYIACQHLLIGILLMLILGKSWFSSFWRTVQVFFYCLIIYFLVIGLYIFGLGLYGGMFN